MRPSDPVNRVMTEAVRSIDVGSPVSEVVRLFSAHPFHHLPVVDRKKVVGMLSSADLLKLEAFLPRNGAVPPAYLDQRLSIERLMRRPPVTVGCRQSLQEAASLMTRHGIHALAVTDSEDHLVGIITTSDLIEVVLRAERSGAPPGAGAEVAPPIMSVEMSPGQMREATNLAAAVAEREDDTGKLARALLHTRARHKALEDVLAAADRYLHAGQDQSLHRLLVKAIAKAREGASTQQ